MKIRIVLSGRNYELAESIPASLELGDGATIDDAIEHVTALLPEGRSLPPSCLLAIGGKHVGTLAAHAPTVLGDGDELVIVAPVAGG